MCTRIKTENSTMTSSITLDRLKDIISKVFAENKPPSVLIDNLFERFKDNSYTDDEPRVNTL